MNRIVPVFGLMCLLTTAQAQSKKDHRSLALDSAIANKSYVFHANTMQPLTGKTRQLTSSYTFRVAKDSVYSDLPYFGRAYAAPLDVTQGPLQFESEKFIYGANATKKGAWNVDIKFNDVRGMGRITLSISKDGYASLQALPINSQPVSFNGTVDKD